jgi:hypothetical protein
VGGDHGDEVLVGEDGCELAVEAGHEGVAVGAVEPPEVSVLVERVTDLVGGRLLDPGGGDDLAAVPLPMVE